MGTPLFTGDVFQWARFCNAYFATIGLKLSNTLPPPTTCGHGITCAEKGETDTPRLTDAYVSKSLVADKIKALKTRKSTGPDNIPPKLLKLQSWTKLLRKLPS